jgi:hypothetical protein
LKSLMALSEWTQMNGNICLIFSSLSLCTNTSLLDVCTAIFFVVGIKILKLEYFFRSQEIEDQIREPSNVRELRKKINFDLQFNIYSTANWLHHQTVFIFHFFFSFEK